MIKYIKIVLIFAGMFSFFNNLTAQKVTKVIGNVVDAKTNKGIPFVAVGFVGTTVGVSTDFDGKFVIETRSPGDSLYASYIGYKTEYFSIKKGTVNKIHFKLTANDLILDEVKIIGKKKKYSKKNNPAIELAKKVINNKYINSLKGKEYYKYKQHEKIKIDFNNISDGIKNSPIVRNVDFVMNYLDTSNVNGKTYLPFFLRETLSNVYYKKKGNILRERRFASKSTQIKNGPNLQTISDILDALYQDIDIYEEQISLLEKQFLSPFAKSGKNFYRYYIIDTTMLNNREVINLAFIPAVKGDLGFTGNIFISNDNKYTVLKVEMTILHDINLNFVSDVKIIQEFEPLGNSYIKTKDQIIVDYNITNKGLGFFGSRTVFYSDFDFQKQDDKYYKGIDKIVYEKGYDKKSKEFWDLNRIRPLDDQEIAIETMIDSLNNNKFIKAYKYIGKLLTSGYAPIKFVDIGYISSFITFNEVEGVNFRFGGETNLTLSNKLKFSLYGAYPLNTKRWKYAAGVTYSFNEDFKSNPRHFIQFTAERESSFPGKEIVFFRPESIFVSLQRGDASRMLFTNTYDLNYTHEMHGFSFYVSGRNRKIEPYGSLEFLSTSNDGVPIKTSDITTTEVGFGIRYAPNEKFVQGSVERTQIFNKFPIIKLDFVQGFNGIFNSTYSYTKLKFDMFKQFQWTSIGTTNLIVEAGKTWGEIPYLLQLIPRGNQTYTYHLNAYNMMNFMEFATDQFASLNMEHYFEGYFLNRIPLIKKLKLREVFSFKAIYGSLSDKNNPYLNPSLIQFPLDKNGNQSTFLFEDEPYMEASIGFTNVFKLLRFDIVKRLNYLDNPNLPTLFGVKGLGVRMKVQLEF